MVKLGSLRGGRDGTLVVVGPGHDRAVLTPGGLATLQAALEDWPRAQRAIAAADALLDAGGGEPLEVVALQAALPRAYQWADASTYHEHMKRLRAARGMALPPDHDIAPIVYNSGSDAFLAPTDSIELGEEAWGLDLEATVAVITGDVPRGTRAGDALEHIRLVLIANDLTYRHLLTAEYAKGVGFYQAKPARSLAPLAVTPQDLGEAWQNGTLHATVRCQVGERTLGELDAGADCAFGFGAVIEHMTRTRALAAGTVIGSGTVSNRDPSSGFGCLAELRALEATRTGEPSTPLLRAGDRVRIEALDRDGYSLFGAIDQVVH
jgi:fumarylacetoacetate (FAA) hydrolase